MVPGSVHATGGSDGVAGPMSEVQPRGAGSRPNERKSNPGGVMGVTPLLPPANSSASRLSEPTKEDNKGIVNMEGAQRAPSIATTSQQSGRRRTGSLRQTAMTKMRERIVAAPPIMRTTGSTPPHGTSANASMHDHTSLDSSSESEWIPSSILDHQESQKHEQSPSPALGLLTGPYVSTTDEEDSMSAHHLSASSLDISSHHTTADAATPLVRHRLIRTEPRVANAAILPLANIDDEDDWDYSETEWWGWVILIAIWVVFVVVMGSCFGVWSWAWDVGETPYAPPDLEDDDTLPITGYYPALLVCTAVMSWVWVVVAWVGLKYFRHSKV
jgi:hypothetical protein